MNGWLHSFWLCFVPLFVAVDAIGILPLFLSLTEGLEHERLRRVIWQSLLTGTAVAVAFVLVGKAVFRLLGITPADFMIAGGSLLFALSLRDLLLAEKAPVGPSDPDSLGAVPVGVPLIVGPAVLTTLIILTDAHGVAPAASAAVVNILLAGAAFWFSGPISRFLGRAGSKAISKLASLLLAAIAVMMIHKGVMGLLHSP